MGLEMMESFLDGDSPPASILPPSLRRLRLASICQMPKVNCQIKPVLPAVDIRCETVKIVQLVKKFKQALV